MYQGKGALVSVRFWTDIAARLDIGGLPSFGRTPCRKFSKAPTRPLSKRRCRLKIQRTEGLLKEGKTPPLKFERTPPPAKCLFFLAENKIA